MFDLRIPESLAAMPGRAHVCMDDDLSPCEQRILTSLRKPKKVTRVRFDYLLYQSVMASIKQCPCGETAWDKMVKEKGVCRNLCKKCNTKRTQDWYARNGRTRKV